MNLNLYHQIDDGIKEGWIVELIEAHTESGPAGYLKLSFIPESEMERWYPNAWKWVIREKGRYGRMRTLIDTPEEEWTRDDIQQALDSCDDWQPYNTARALKEQRKAASDEELRDLWQQRRQKIEQENQADYQRFRAFHMNRPLIDFIRVYDEEEWLIHDGGRQKELKEPLGYSSKRQGIATLLYETGAVWMHNRGMSMHASGNQSESAQSVWEGFREQGLVKTVPASKKAPAKKQRQVFDVQRLLAQKPELRDSIVST